MLEQLAAKAHRNRLRRSYYDHKTVLKDLGISIPPSMRSIEAVLEWPAKAVDVLSRRLVLEGFRSSGAVAPESLGLDAVWDWNRLDVEAPQVHTAALVHAVAFLTVTAGDVAAGEPAVLITARSAQYATGLWDARRRQLSAALSVLSVDDQGAPDQFVLYAPNVAVVARRDGLRWDLRQSRHDLGVPVEPLVYKPMLDRPFGHSRISRPVMSLTDSAVRTLVRSEVSAEFYSAPQRYVLGADEEAFVDENGNRVPAWTSILGRVLALSRDENGDVPTVGQFAQATMQPHMDQLRGLATMFASAANIPVSALGIVQDNPASADAIRAADEPLIAEAEHAQIGFRGAWERTVRRALAVLDSSPAALAEYSRLRAWFRPADVPTRAAAADATVKLVQASILAADSEVTWDQMGFTEPQREVLRVEARTRRAAQLAQSLGVAGAAALTREPVAAVVGERGSGAA